MRIFQPILDKLIPIFQLTRSDSLKNITAKLPKLNIMSVRFAMSLQCVLVGLALLSWGIAGAKQVQAAEILRPNILWIIGEDMGPELSCYGTPEVWTGNLDKLAAQGVRYTNAFTTAPVCSASRSAFITGMYQTTIGAHNHRSHRKDGYQLPTGVRIITDWLRETGYYTGNIRRITDEVRGSGKTDWNFQTEGKPFDTSRWSDLKSHQPFYAQVNFGEAHRGKQWPEARRKNKQLADPAKVVLPPYYPDHPLARDDWANYLDAITRLDYKVGIVLDQLAKDGLADNTIIFFLGDHGRAMVRGKQWCYDSGLHIPLIVYVPEKLANLKNFQPGSVSSQLISAIDLTATTLSLSGMVKPEKMQGRVLFGPTAERPRSMVFSARDRCDETVFRIRTVREKRYRYIHNFMPERPFLQLNRYKETTYPVINLMRELHAQGKLDEVQQVLLAPHRPAEELYDVTADPYEIDNLADLPEHQAVLTQMRREVDSWIEKTDDQGRFPESDEVINYWEKTQERNYRERMKR